MPDSATPAPETAHPHRPVRSFVLRQGRMSDAQQRALSTLMPRYGLPFTSGHVDFAATFGRVAPVILEIGFGMGDATAVIAEAHPQHDFVGIEVHSPGVGALLRQLDALTLSNVRVISHDAVEVVAAMIPPESLAGIHVYFPDPWPKKRHHKRRLLQPAFVRALAQRLGPQGYLHVATDWQEYADAILAVLAAEPLLANCADGFAPRPSWRPRTKFETRGMRLGHGVWDLLYRRTCVDQ